MFRSLMSLVLAAVFASSAAYADVQVSVFGKKFNPNGCTGYVSAIQGEFVVEYKNTTLEWGTTVELIYGFNNTFRDNDSWVHEGALGAMASAPYTWRVALIENVDERGTYHATDFRFLFKINPPHAPSYYDKGPGNFSLQGYYTAPFEQLNTGCSRDGSSLMPLTVGTVQKN